MAKGGSLAEKVYRKSGTFPLQVVAYGLLQLDNKLASFVLLEFFGGKQTDPNRSASSSSKPGPGSSSGSGGGGSS